MPEDPVAALAEYLSATEARQLQVQFEAGETMTSALRVVVASRRSEVRSLLVAAGLGTQTPDLTSAVLGAVVAALGRVKAVDPIWTVPGDVTSSGRLTSAIAGYVNAARSSVICSTFNFQRSSALWTALRDAARRPDMRVRIYVDTAAADSSTWAGSPTTAEIASELRPADVLRTRFVDGKPLRNHAKFLALDHQTLIVTSANFSASAETRNLELGLVLENPGLTQLVERHLLSLEQDYFELVR